LMAWLNSATNIRAKVNKAKPSWAKLNCGNTRWHQFLVCYAKTWWALWECRLLNSLLFSIKKITNCKVGEINTQLVSGDVTSHLSTWFGSWNAISVMLQKLSLRSSKCNRNELAPSFKNMFPTKIPNFNFKILVGNRFLICVVE
jgi:hypothetical protein